MDYDVIIIGAGPAGLSCALSLAQAQKRCLVLEKRTELTGKVCGDGLSSHCIEVLKDIGIYESQLIALGGKKVNRNITSNRGQLEQRYYQKKKGYERFAIGLSRDVFDPYLMQRAVDAGAKVCLGHKVTDITKEEGSAALRMVRQGKNSGKDAAAYIVDGKYRARRIVLACGAYEGQSFGIPRPSDLPVGISARVRGDCNLASNAFYFKYDWEYGDGYAWLFPVGENLWNFGVWSSNRRSDIRKLFARLESRLKSVYFSDFTYERKPKGALIGATRKKVKPHADCIGDCQYIASYESGEGISFAIQSGLLTAQAIIRDEDPTIVHYPAKHAFCEEVTVLQREILISNG